MEESTSRKVFTGTISIGMIFSIIVVASLILPSIALFLYSLFQVAPPEPEIQYGEFPFRLEYEIGGNLYVIEDILIAEFLRSARGDITGSASRVWKTTLKSDAGDENWIRFDRFILKEANGVRITFGPGSAWYFMGDVEGAKQFLGWHTSYQPHIMVATTYIPFENAQDILEEHGVAITYWSIAEPIENNFPQRGFFLSCLQ